MSFLTVPKTILKAMLPVRCRNAIRTFLKFPGYIGFKYECPCCGGRWRRLKPFGTPPRRNAMCPRCGSRERERALLLYLQQHTNLIQTPGRLLHMAPEPSIRIHLEDLPGLEYISGDIEDPRVALHFDITSIPLPDATFDYVICNHVLEHVVDDRTAMSEILRVLKPGGWAVVNTPIDQTRTETYEDPAITSPEERLEKYGQHDHVRIYGRDYWTRLRDTGFLVEVVQFGHQVGTRAASRYRFGEDEQVTLCKKPA